MIKKTETPKSPLKKLSLLDCAQNACLKITIRIANARRPFKEGKYLVLNSGGTALISNKLALKCSIVWVLLTMNYSVSFSGSTG
jgi:hypothetical protein